MGSVRACGARCTHGLYLKGGISGDRSAFAGMADREKEFIFSEGTLAHSQPLQTKQSHEESPVTNTGHAIGDRPEVIAKFGGAYIAENGAFAKLIPGKSDLDAEREVAYPVTGGRYVVSFKGAPTIRFEKQ